MNRNPDYYLKVLDRHNENRGKVGAAWLNEDDSINIKLDLAVVLDYRDSDRFNIVLFPNEYKDV